MDLIKFQLEHEDILARYRQKLGKKIAKDGLICPEKYFSESNRPRLLFVLQTPNMKEGENVEWSLMDDLRENGGQWQTWGTLAKWIYAVNSIVGTGIISYPGELNNRENMKEILKHSAFININKHGTPPGTDWRCIALEDSKIYEISYLCGQEIEAQIGILNPDLIIGCGTGNSLRQILCSAIDETTRRITKTGYWHYKVSSSRLISNMLCYNHPAYLYKGQKKTTEVFLNSIKEIIGKQ